MRGNQTKGKRCVMDLISRQAAIDAINDLPNCPNGYSDTYDKASIISALEDVPSAQPETILGNCASCAFHRNWTNSSRLHEWDGERCDSPDAVPGSPK